jgi:hypothetical protein
MSKARVKRRVQKFLATETAANASTERSACNGDDSAMVTGMAATVSCESYCPSNDKDDSNSESSFDSSQYDDFGPPSDDDEEGYLCFGSPPSSEDMDVFVTEFAPLSEGASSTLASVSDTSHAPPLQTWYDDDCCEEFPPMSSVGGGMDLTALEMASLGFSLFVMTLGLVEGCTMTSLHSYAGSTSKRLTLPRQRHAT